MVLCALHSIDDFGELLVLAVHQAVQVAVVVTLFASLRLLLIPVRVVHSLDSILKLFFRGFELEIIEEADKFALTWLQFQLARKEGYTNFLDELEDVNFLVKFLECVFLQEVIALLLHAAAEAPT